MELIKDYDMTLHYHPDKANVVADALSQKSYANTLVSTGLPEEKFFCVVSLLESETTCKRLMYTLIKNKLYPNIRMGS